MTTYLFQHALQDADSLSKDRYVNTFHVDYFTGVFPEVNVPSLADVVAIAQLIKLFYDGTNATKAGYYIAAHAFGAGATVKAYNLSDPKPRAPIYEEMYTPAAPTSPLDPLPGECAITISFEAEPLSGQPMARRRGRIYVGPLQVRAIDGTNPMAPARVTPICINSFNDAFGALATGINALQDWTFVQYSARNATSAPIQRHWVDNAFDTQRRRGVAATMRTVVEVSD